MKKRSQAPAKVQMPDPADFPVEREPAATADDVFGKASGSFPPPPAMRDGFARLVQTIYDEGDLDVLEEYREIEAALNLGDAMSPGAIKARAARAEEMARRAYRLYLLARFEYEAYTRKSDVCYGAIRDAARSRLERDKKVGARTKQVTDADVAAEAAMAYPDEWADICDRRERAKGMRDMVEKLADLAERQCFSLGRLLEPGTGRV